MRFQLDVHDLVNRGLVTRKYDEATGLYVLKYKNSVFFNNLWGVDDRLLECRGTVVDENYNVISRPFTKVFNYKENGTYVDAYAHVLATRKVNGFLGVLTAYKGEPLFSTTGSLSGKYVDLARDVITKQLGGEQRVKDFLLHERTRSVMSAKNSTVEDLMGEFTYMFEICSPDDPHIVHEHPGAYLIGARRNHITKLPENLLSEYALDIIAERWGFLRPVTHKMMFLDVLDMIKTHTRDKLEIEGYMIRMDQMNPTNSHVMKIKTPLYLAKKFVMRGGNKKWDLLWSHPEVARQHVDEEFYSLIDYLHDEWKKEDWITLGEQERRSVVEDFFMND